MDASRCGLVADGVTDNTAKLQAALSTCPVGGTVYVPAGTYRTQSLFLQSNTTLYLEKGCTLLGGTERTRLSDFARCPPLPQRKGRALPGPVGGQPPGQLCGAYQCHQRRECDHHRRGHD